MILLLLLLQLSACAPCVTKERSLTARIYNDHLQRIGSVVMQNVQWPISFDTKNCESSLFSNRASPSTDLVLLLLLLLMMMMMMKQNIAVWNRSAIVVAVPLGGGEVNDADSWRTAVMPPRRYSPTPSVIQPCRRPGWENGRRAGGCRQSKGDGSVRCGGSHGNECRR